jgi:hypothetical protein
MSRSGQAQTAGARGGDGGWPHLASPDSRTDKPRESFDGSKASYSRDHLRRDETTMSIKTASDIRQQLQLLETERALALDTMLAHDPAYMTHLREEIFATRHAYVGSAVVEIASFRAQLSGAQAG